MNASPACFGLQRRNQPLRGGFERGQKALFVSVASALPRGSKGRERKKPLVEVSKGGRLLCWRFLRGRQPLKSGFERLNLRAGVGQRLTRDNAKKK